MISRSMLLPPTLPPCHSCPLSQLPLAPHASQHVPEAYRCPSPTPTALELCEGSPAYGLAHAAPGPAPATLTLPLPPTHTTTPCPCPCHRDPAPTAGPCPLPALPPQPCTSHQLHHSIDTTPLPSHTLHHTFHHTPLSCQAVLDTSPEHPPSCWPWRWQGLCCTWLDGEGRQGPRQETPPQPAVVCTGASLLC